MKEKGILDNHHKELALNNITYSDIKKVIEVL